MIAPDTLFFALLGGILPALLWLWFWLREDARPEPRRLIVRTFFAGIFIVPVALVLERYIDIYAGGAFLIIVWASIEEAAKFGAAYFAVLRLRDTDEPIDPLIYMITVALGFAAIENSLFLLDPLRNGNFLASIVTGNLRFFGATLLHTLSSSVVGLAMALPYYRRKVFRREILLCGIILASVLHSVFNFLILESSGSQVLVVFSGVWAGIIALIVFFEKVKRIKRPRFIYLKNKNK